MQLKVAVPERMEDLGMHSIQRAPFDWAHANLEPVRAYLLKAREEGKFVPQFSLPL